MCQTNTTSQHGLFRALSSGYKDFGEVFGLMAWAWQEAHKPFFKDIIFNCADFLKRRHGQFEYIMAIKDDVTESDTAPYDIIEFEGGLYALAVCIDGDDESGHKVEEKILRWIESTNFEYDESRDVMGHMTYCDDEIKKGLGYEQLQKYIPIKLKP